jgi:hypothetical protein
VSIVAELERNLELEPPRANIDLRNTLQAPVAPGSKKAKKTVAYEVSELRGVEVIEQLCPGMDQYGILREEDGSVSFQRYNAKGAGSVKIMGSMVLGSDQFQLDRKRLQAYCDGLVEENEDALLEAIRSAGLAKLARKQEELKIAKAIREGRKIEEDSEIDEVTRAYFKLGLDPIASPGEVRRSYRQLSKTLHPDKVGEDAELLKEFHDVSKAYETITGEALTPYGDLYRQVCVEIVQVCANDEEVQSIFKYFPKVKGSKIPGMMETEDEVQSRLGNSDPEVARRDNAEREAERRELWKKWEEEEAEKLRKEERREKKKAKKAAKKNKSAKRTVGDLDEF